MFRMALLRYVGVEMSVHVVRDRARQTFSVSAEREPRPLTSSTGSCYENEVR